MRSRSEKLARELAHRILDGYRFDGQPTTADLARQLLDVLGAEQQEDRQMWRDVCKRAKELNDKLAAFQKLEDFDPYSDTGRP